MTWQANTRAVTTAMFGLSNALVGFYFLHMEMNQKPPSNPLVYLFAAWIGIGFLIIAPSLMLGAFQPALALLGQVRIGGDRKTDPPASP